MEKRIALKHLDKGIVLEIYDTLARPTGRASFTSVAREMEKLGIYNQYTGKPFSVQAVERCIRKHIPDLPDRKRGGKLPPILCYNAGYPLISDWLHSKYPDMPMIGYRTITVEDCVRRDVYGSPPLACMLAASNVYWVFYDHQPILRDVVPNDDFYVVKIRCVSWNKPFGD